MNIALILSGGTGIRMGSDVPKQYVEVKGKPIICYSMERLAHHRQVDWIQIVAAQEWQEQIEQWMQKEEFKMKFRGFSIPGANRHLSILNGLRDILSYGKDMDAVFVHDAARPLLSDMQITDCLEGIAGHDGVMPVLPMKDTVYSSLDGKSVGALLNRSEIYAGQAPEVFRLRKYYEANQRLLPDKILQINGATEPAIMAGMDIAMIPGDERNFKITTKTDLENFNRIVEEQYILAK